MDEKGGYIRVNGKNYRACWKCGGDGEYKMPGSPQFGMPCTACHGTGSLKLGVEKRVAEEAAGEIREIIELKREVARCYKKIQEGKMPLVYRTKANEAWAKLLERSQRMTLDEIKYIAGSLDE